MNKYYGQFQIPVDEFIYERYFKSKKFMDNGFFIECGAFDGLTECSCKFFEETLGWKGINVEPSPVIFSKLIENRPDSINVNVALSNENTTGVFHSVVHPFFGEQCTNGSLQHTPEHKKILDDMNCQYREHEVKIITYSDLIDKYHVKHVDLFVLDVEGNELKVISSMRGGHTLPDVMCIEHGNSNKEEIIDAMESLGYEYDISSYVNSFFVKKKSYSILKKLFTKNKYNEKFFELAKITEMYVREGRVEDISVIKKFINKGNTFGIVSVDSTDEIICIYSVCGVDGEACDGQVVRYYLQGDAGDSVVFLTVPQERPDYADFRKSDLYRMAGSRVLVERGFFKSAHYDVRILLEHGGKRFLLKCGDIML